MDKSWFASPEERDRAKRANLDMYASPLKFDDFWIRGSRLIDSRT